MRIKNEALKNFINYTQNNNKSAIYDYFYGCMKKKTACDGCSYAKRKIAYYSFNSFNFASFNLDLVQKQCKNENNINLERLFQIQNNICIKIDTNKMKFCKYCNSIQVHHQRKQFYSFPNFLIICLDRGYNCQNKNKILYDLNLDLQRQSELLQSPKKFKLIGIIKRLDKDNREHYISIYFDYKLKSWYLRDDSSLTKINNPLDHKQGIEMIFFYKKC